MSRRRRNGACRRRLGVRLATVRVAAGEGAMS
jgi:hypothetical protein